MRRTKCNLTRATERIRAGDGTPLGVSSVMTNRTHSGGIPLAWVKTTRTGHIHWLHAGFFVWVHHLANSPYKIPSDTDKHLA